MEFKINASSSVNVSKAMRAYIQDAMSQVTSELPEDSSVNCTVKTSKKEKRFKVIVSNHQYTIRAETESDDFYDAVNQSVEKIRKSIRKVQQKKIDVKRKVEQKTHYVDERPVFEEPVAKEKDIYAVAMSTESAILQMETMDYDFFLFLDSKTLNPSVVYYRKDGSIGRLNLLNA